MMRSSHDERWSDRAAQAGGQRNSAALASVKAREQLAARDDDPMLMEPISAV
jgi:hypothetical protein